MSKHISHPVGFSSHFIFNDIWKEIVKKAISLVKAHFDSRYHLLPFLRPFFSRLMSCTFPLTHQAKAEKVVFIITNGDRTSALHGKQT